MDLEFVYLFMTIAMLTICIIGALILIPMTFVCRKIDFIKANMFMFGIELILIAVLPSLPIIFFIYSRGYSVSIAIQSFYICIIGFAVLHVLLETSGYYDYMLKH
jgi:hypothetical protein